MADSIIWLIHLATVGFMTGLIWLIQVVQYPLFLSVGPREFPEFHRLHSQWITPVVGPVMALELVSAMGLVASQAGPDSISVLERWFLLALTLVVFGVTAFVSVPLHNRLSSLGPNPEVIRALIRTNWVRTWVWTLHAALAFYGTFRLIRSE